MSLSPTLVESAIEGMVESANDYGLLNGDIEDIISEFLSELLSNMNSESEEAAFIRQLLAQIEE